MLSVTNLGCRRGDLRVLSGVTFRVAPGEALVLRGPNGSGKTTLLRTLAGLAPPDGGTISLRGQHPGDSPEDLIAYAGHADGLKSQLSVGENLRFWADVFGQRNIETALQTFELTPLVNRQASNLSAGQKRRLGLSRMLVTGRKIWLLDEPTVSLDVESTAIFAQMIAAHLKTGGSAVLATHIDLGLEAARTLDITRFKARPEDHANPFLDGPFT